MYQLHFSAPFSASTAKSVHDSVLKTHTPSSHAGVEGPSSPSPIAHAGSPVRAWKA